jgi:hypothetical protein
VTVVSTIPSVSSPPLTGATVSATLTVVDALQYCRRAAEFLESLKNQETDREGNPFSSLLAFLF